MKASVTSRGPASHTSRERVTDQIARAQRVMKRLPLFPVRGLQGWRFAQRVTVPDPPASRPAEPNPLEAYFDANVEGPGIWKFRHYFDIYHRHFSKFVGKEVTVVEIGIYSGGSLGMWRHYFGDRACVVGVDIEQSCKVYENESVRIFIGDQADPEFWARFRSEVPIVDVIIDDGGHQPDQQIATLEALLPHMRPGGVYLCEDLSYPYNGFHQYVCGLSRGLNVAPSSSGPTELQKSVDSISFYPYITVIERRMAPLEELIAPQHGTEWQPFLDKYLAKPPGAIV